MCRSVLLWSTSTNKRAKTARFGFLSQHLNEIRISQGKFLRRLTPINSTQLNSIPACTEFIAAKAKS